MSDLGSQLNKLTPAQRQSIMIKAQHEANQQVMQLLLKDMTTLCFDKCTGTSVRGRMTCLIVDNVFLKSKTRWREDSEIHCTLLVRLLIYLFFSIALNFFGIPKQSCFSAILPAIGNFWRAVHSLSINLINHHTTHTHTHTISMKTTNNQIHSDFCFFFCFDRATNWTVVNNPAWPCAKIGIWKRAPKYTMPCKSDKRKGGTDDSLTHYFWFFSLKLINKMASIFLPCYYSCVFCRETMKRFLACKCCVVVF